MSFRPKIKNKLLAVLFAILPAFVVGALAFGANVYYDLDAAKIMINENNEIVGSLTVSGNSILATGASTTNTFGSGASSINTIGSATTPGALTLHGATALDNTFALTYSGASTALTVTQSGTGAIVALTNLGSGNSLVINDEATDTTPFVIDASGNVGIGTTTPVSKLDVRGTIENGLVGWWPMDEGSGSTAVDYSINNKNGTITGSSCPAGYILVPGDATYGTGDFCVMQYEAKCAAGDEDGSNGCTSPFNAATSRFAGTPWASITQTAAITACSSAGGHLITNNEWMTIARNVEQVAGNWTLGSVGSGYLFAGHNDNAPGAAKAASATNTGDYRCAYTDTAGTTENPTPCPTNTAAGASGTAGNQVRVLTLSNGQAIWDIAGNVWEWTNDTIQGKDQPTSGSPGFAWREFTNLTTYGTLTYDKVRPSNSSYVSTYGVGRIYSDGTESNTTVYAFLRGGYWYDTSDAGAFALNLGNAPAFSSSRIGFRCVR